VKKKSGGKKTEKFGDTIESPVQEEKFRRGAGARSVSLIHSSKKKPKPETDAIVYSPRKRDKEKKLKP